MEGAGARSEEEEGSEGGGETGDGVEEPVWRGWLRRYVQLDPSSQDARALAERLFGVLGGYRVGPLPSTAALPTSPTARRRQQRTVALSLAEVVERMTSANGAHKMRVQEALGIGWRQVASPSGRGRRFEYFALTDGQPVSPAEFQRRYMREIVGAAGEPGEGPGGDEEGDGADGGSSDAEDGTGEEGRRGEDGADGGASAGVGGAPVATEWDAESDGGSTEQCQAEEREGEEDEEQEEVPDDEEEEQEEQKEVLEDEEEEHVEHEEEGQEQREEQEQKEVLGDEEEEQDQEEQEERKEEEQHEELEEEDEEEHSAPEAKAKSGGDGGTTPPMSPLAATASPGRDSCFGDGNPMFDPEEVARALGSPLRRVLRTPQRARTSVAARPAAEAERVRRAKQELMRKVREAAAEYVVVRNGHRRGQ